jgi:tetratricopeptide (TPR) repeat protein
LDYYGVMQSINSFIAGLLFAVWVPASVQAAPPPPPADTVPARSALNSTLFYQLLLAEISANQNDAATAYALMLDAARRTPSEQLFERAVNIALHARSGDSALEAAQAWSKAFPKSQNANRYVLQILIGLSRIPESLAPLQRSISLAALPDRLTMVRVIPRYYARANEKALVARLVQAALARWLETPGALGGAAWATVGQMRRNADDHTGALDAALQGVKQDPGSSDVGLLAVELMHPERRAAENLVLQILDVAPTPELRMAYARQSIESKQFRQAYVQLQALNLEKPDFADAWLLRASIELQDNLLSQSSTSLKTYIALEEAAAKSANTTETGRGLMQAYLLMSQVAAQSQQYAEADDYLQRIRSAEDFFAIQTRRALLLAQQGRLDEARTLIRDLPEKQPQDARTKLNAELQILRERKEHQATYDLLKEGVQRFVQDVDLLYDLAIAADRLKRFDEMELVLRQVMQLQPDYHHAYNALGYSFAERNIRLNEAHALVTKALSLAPNDAHIQDSMGWVEFRRGHWDEALRWLQQAFETMPDAEIAAHWGEVLWVKGQREQAQAVWNKGLELSRDNTSLNETLQRLRDQP